MDDDRFLSELRRSWDESARGEPAAPDALDPELAALLRYLQALRDAPPPDPIFANHLRESLMHATTMPLPLTDPLAGPGRNGRWALPTNHTIRAPLTAFPAQRAPTHLATAVLVLIVLIGSVIAFGSIRLWPVNPITLPAAYVQEGTPAGTSDTRFEVTFPAPVLPAGPVHAWSTMYDVEPGVSAAYPGFAIEDPIAAVVWVQSGTMAINGEPIAVHRASASASEASTAPGEMVLSAGDAVGLELGPDRSYQLRSVGPEPLVFAEFWIVGGPPPIYTLQKAYRFLDYHNIDNATTLTSPATVTMRLTRTALPGKAAQAPPEGTWQLAIAARPSNLSRLAATGALRNTSQDPITVVVMTAEFQEGAATPTAGTPAP